MLYPTDIIETKYSDLICVNNSKNEYIGYKWFKNNKENKGADKQFGGFAVKNKFSTDDGDLETRRYYIEQNLEVYGDYPQHHLYTESGFSGKSSSKAVVGGIFEPNLIIRLAPNVDLRCGLYVLYSFTQQNKSTKDPLYNPDCMTTAFSTRLSLAKPTRWLWEDAWG